MALRGLRRIVRTAIYAVLALQRLSNLKGEAVKKSSLAMLVVLLAAGCVGRFDSDTVAKRDSGTAANPVVDEGYVPPMDRNRQVSEQDCSRPVATGGGNLMCKGGSGKP